VIPKGVRGCADDACPFSNGGIYGLLHNDLIAEYPCDGELIPMEELSTKRLRLLWCASCGTEITNNPDCEWVWIVLPGMKSDLKV
jgi:hypothetical protein